jgi:hypothetical protein
MIRLVSPADPFEARALLAQAVRGKPTIARRAALQLAHSASVGFEEASPDGSSRLVAVMTAYPTDLVLEGLSTLEISCAGIEGLARPRGRMRACARLARLTLDHWHQNGTVALLGVVKAGHLPGAKLARLAGFTFREARQGLELYVRMP